MITHITVQGFKSLLNVPDLALGQVNVFIGANGSGKSNLLEAIGLLGAAASGHVDDQALLRRGVRPGTPALFLSSFKGVERARQIRVHTTWRAGPGPVEYQATFTARGMPQQGWAYEATLKFNDQGMSWPPFESSFTPEEPAIAKQLLAVLADYAIFAPETPLLRGTQTDITQRPPVGLAGGRLAEAVAELLDARRDALGALDMDDLLRLLDWVDEIAVVPPSSKLISPSVPATRKIIRFTDRWMAKASNQLAAYDASEGALYVLFALVLALHPDSPRLFAIENLDQAMHPRLARATVRLFCQQVLQAAPRRQALLTTHNPLVLDGLDLRDDRIRLFTVERNAQGATRVDRVQVSDDVLKATQAGLTLSNLWVMGRLGGAPDIF